MKYADFEARLRQRGFQHDTSEDAPICRWLVGGVKVDIMPDKPEAMGMRGRWFPEALEHALPKEIIPGIFAPIVTVPFFVATKLEAFNDRGNNDFRASHDLEDLIAVIDGRSDLVKQLLSADKPVRNYVAIRFRELLSDESFIEALPGHLPPDAASQQRVPIIRQRMQEVAASVTNEPGETTRKQG